MARVIQLVAAYFVGVYTGNWAYFAAVLMGEHQGHRARDKARRAQQRARDEYNASLQDRLEMVDITPDQPRTLVLGRVRAVEGVRRKWVGGEHNRKLTLIVSFAGHEIDAFEAFYFDDIELTLAGDGRVLTAPYAKTVNDSQQVTGTLDGLGTATIALPHVPVAGSIVGTYSYLLGESAFATGPLTVVAVDGSTVTVSGGEVAASANYTVAYQHGVVTYTARIRAWTGGDAQHVGAALAAEHPAQTWLPTARFAGMAAAAVEIDFDPDVYPQGRPNVTARMRAARCYDPRLDSTNGGSGPQRLAEPDTWTWTENPALHAVRYALWEHGWRLRAADIHWGDIRTAADVCDESVTLSLRTAAGAVTHHVLPRYRCGIVVSSAGDPRAQMDDILETMAGRAGWAGGLWRVRAGHMPAPTFAMDASWLAHRLAPDGRASRAATVQITNGLPREQKVNRVTGRCIDPDQRWQALPFPAVQDAALIAAEGEVYPLEVDFPGVAHIARAQHLASLLIRRAQAPLTLAAQCNLLAYPCELFDVGTLTLPRYAIADKTMEVIGWRWHPTEGVQLRLQEITQALHDPWPELTGRDPAPNTNLPRAWEGEDLTGLAVASGGAELVDGSLLTRTRLTWTPAATQRVRAGGTVELQWVELAAFLVSDWSSTEVPGDVAEAIIPALRTGVDYLFRARFRTAPPFRVPGQWGAHKLHRVTLPPLLPWSNVDGSAAVDEAIAAALDAANDAQTTADGKVQTFWQPGQPTGVGEGEGDIWFDTDDGAKQYRYTSGTWVDAADTRIGDAIDAAADAQSTADGKVTTFVGSSEPTAEGFGDLWLFDTGNGNRLLRWDGDSWEPYPVGTEGLAPGSATHIDADVYDFGGAGYGNFTARTVSITPPVDCLIEFSAKITASGLYADGGNALSWRVTPAGGSELFLGGSATNDPQKQDVVAMTSLAAAGGVQLDFVIRTHKGGGPSGPSVHLFESYMRITQIRR